jgi:hypothetical protein
MPPDDDTMAELLRAALDLQKQEAQERHQVLLDKLAERDGAQPLSPAAVRRTMEAGYAATAAEREAKRAGGGQ